MTIRTGTLDKVPVLEFDLLGERTGMKDVKNGVSGE